MALRTLAVLRISLRLLNRRKGSGPSSVDDDILFRDCRGSYSGTNCRVGDIYSLISVRRICRSDEGDTGNHKGGGTVTKTRNGEV